MSRAKMKPRKKVVMGVIILGIAGSIAIVPMTPARGFSLGGLLSLGTGILQSQTGIDISPYIQMAQQFISFFKTKSLGNLFDLATMIYEQVGQSNSAIVGAAGSIDWELLREAIGEAVDTENQSAAQALSSVLNGAGSSLGSYSSGLRDPRFGILATTEKEILEDKTMVSLGDAELNTILGPEGQEFIAEQRKQMAKIAEASNKSAQTQKGLENTQDILKAQGEQNSASTQLLNAVIEELLQGRIAQYENNRATFRHLKYAQLQEWKEEVGNSFAKRNMFSSGDIFVGLIDPETLNSQPANGNILGSSSGNNSSSSNISNSPVIGFPMPNSLPNGGWGAP
jgi:hypothetical protein